MIKLIREHLSTKIFIITVCLLITVGSAIYGMVALGMSRSRRKRRSSLLYKEDFHCSRSCIDRYMSFDVWTYVSDHIFWRHGTRKCKTLYFHGNMYHDRKTNRVDHGIYSTIWIQGSRRC